MGTHFIDVNIYQDLNKAIPLRIHLNILDRHDGSYIIRYRLYQSYTNLIIQIRTIDQREISGSPVYLNGKFHYQS